MSSQVFGIIRKRRYRTGQLEEHERMQPKEAD
jgi:hypothetical protein